MATILENGIRESGYQYEGETSLADILEKETTKDVRNQQNGRQKIVMLVSHQNSLQCSILLNWLRCLKE